MLHVFIVEDEIVVRKGLCKNIKWEELGLALVGEASDGELAYNKIKEIDVDILITDIKMPFMDGLQLSRLVKKEMPGIKIIIVSGYDDFAYAKQAINIGVTEYLLKPVSVAQMTETVLAVKKTIEREREQQQYMEQFRHDRQEYEKMERKHFFKELVGGRTSVSDLLEKSSRLALQLSAACYNLILFQLFQDDECAQDEMDALICAEQTIEKHFSFHPNLILFERELDGFALLVKGNNEEADPEHRAMATLEQTCVETIQRVIDEREGVGFFIAVGKRVNRLTDLPAAFLEVRKAFVYRYIGDKNEIVHAGKRQEIPQATAEAFVPEMLHASKVDKKILERFLKWGDRDDTDGFVEDYFNGILLDGAGALMFRQYVAIDAMMTVISFVEAMGFEREAFIRGCGDGDQMADMLSTVEMTKAYLGKMITKALSLRAETASQKYASIIHAARDYILENFSREDISLSQVSAFVNVSPSHFSTIFGQNTGSTFVEYLTNIRIEKAMELLRCSGLRASEVSYTVGYRDPHYFSYLFKKKLGCTPKEFRAKGQNRCES